MRIGSNESRGYSHFLHSRWVAPLQPEDLELLPSFKKRGEVNASTTAGPG